MGSHPVNLGLRFLLELAALASYGYWGWSAGNGWIKYLLVITLPILAAIVWGTFAVPDDPSRSGKAPVPVPGSVRLVLELLIFGLAGWALFDRGAPVIGWIYTFLLILHYSLSFDRIQWLFSKSDFS